MMSAFQRVSAVLAVLAVGGGLFPFQVVAQTYHLSPSGVQQVNEGTNFVFNCTVETGSPPLFFVRLDGNVLSTRLSEESISGGSRFTFGPVTTSDSGSALQCLVGDVVTENATLDVTFRPRFSPTMAMATPTEDEQFTFPFQLSANPAPNINLTRSGTPVTDARVTVTTTSLTIADITRSDSGEYQITASNVAGSTTFTLTVDVYYPPEFTVPSQNVTRNAARNESFTFDCTPSDGNPAVYSYTFLKNSVPVTEGVSGSVLTINPVVRSSRGVYTCTASNTAGTAVVTRNLFVVDVPTRPLNPRVMDLMPFSATLQWDPPSDNGGSSLPLTYTITLINASTFLPFSAITATSLPLPNLQHSTQYSWLVQAINEYGSSPPAEDTFTTPDSVPIIDTVSAMALSLSAFRVNVTLLTDGGQRVALYTIEIRGVNYTGIVESSDQSWVSVLVNQLDQNFTKGETHTVRVFATNSVGTSNPRSPLLIVPDAPTMPLNPRVVDLMPFSVTLQWNPPSDNGGSPLPLAYTVILTNTSTSLPFSDITATSLPLPNLQHSTQYNWSVQATTEYGSSPPAEGTFNTPDSVPIIDSVEAAVLSLFEVEVNISLLTNGGQSVTQYIVEVNGINYTFLSSEELQVSLLVNQLRVNFTKGERVTLRAFAVNSVGTSDPVSADVTAPFPPNVTAPPTELSTANIPVCCAGVQLNLAKPDDPSIRVWVLVDGTLHPPNQVIRNGSFLYIMGLQAGTEYSLNITLTDRFGTMWVNITVRPLLGHPSTPQVALTPTAGGLTVQLTVMYPGTREDTLQYSISTSPSPLSRRQTGQQPLPVTDLTTPTSGSAEVALVPGTYSVTVTVTNQHGSTTSEPQEVTIPVSCPECTDQTPAVVALSAVLVVVVLLLAVAILTIILLYTRNQKMSSVLKAMKDPNYHYADVEMESHNLTKSHSKSTTEPQYEECGGGVISSNVAMEDNPAYQSVDVAAAKP